MIVKNEEANLAECISPVARLVDEIIVVDTGSTDRTKEIAVSLGAKVVDFPWVDDFAAARNESLRHAGGDWIFWLDADDRIVDGELRTLQKLFAELPDDNTAFFMAIWSAPDEVLHCPVIVDQPRLFRKSAGLLWQYRVHEQIAPSLQKSGARFVCSDVVVHHLGYMTAEARSHKRRRNLQLLNLDLIDHPEDPYLLFNLANTLFDEGKWQDAFRFASRCLELAPGDGAFVPKLFVLLVRTCRSLGRDDEAMEFCRTGMERFPNERELWFEEGVGLMARGDMDAAKRSFESVVRLRNTRSVTGFNPELQYHARHNLAFIHSVQGNVHEAEHHWRRILDELPHFGPAWLGLIEIFLGQKQQDKMDHLFRRAAMGPHASRILPGLQARIALKKRDWSRSQQILEAAIEQFPHAIWLRLLLADILLQVANDRTTAATHLRQILLLDPNHLIANAKLRSLMPVVLPDPNPDEHRSAPGIVRTCIREMAAVCCYFNPCHYASRRRNYELFRKHLASTGLRLLTVEMAFGTDEYELHQEDVLRLRGGDVLWQKERLLNIGIRALAEQGFSKVVWLDADILFHDPAWHEKLASTLDEYPICQAFSHVDIVHQHGTAGAPGFAANLHRTGQVNDAVAAPGFAWGARAEVISRAGLYDACVVGGGDLAFVLGAYCALQNGVADDVISHLAKVFNLNPIQCNHYRNWAKDYGRAFRGRIGHLEGGITTLYHGTLENRKYWERYQLLHDFDPFHDIELNDDRCWRWGTSKPELHERVRNYFFERREDDQASLSTNTLGKR